MRCANKGPPSFLTSEGDHSSTFVSIVRGVLGTRATFCPFVLVSNDREGSDVAKRASYMVHHVSVRSVFRCACLDMTITATVRFWVNEPTLCFLFGWGMIYCGVREGTKCIVRESANGGGVNVVRCFLGARISVRTRSIYLVANGSLSASRVREANVFVGAYFQLYRRRVKHPVVGWVALRVCV